MDYEEKKQYELTVRATDSISGVYAEVLVSILVQDVNDCPPEFTQDSYNVSVSEAASFGTSILKVSSRDNDTGKSSLLLLLLNWKKKNNLKLNKKMYVSMIVKRRKKI